MQLRYSAAMARAPWSIPLGLVAITGIDPGSLQAGLSHWYPAVASQTTSDRDRVLRRISTCESFFEENGFRCPLRQQLNSIQNKGLPPASPIVQALLFSEMTTGLLMGAQDSSAIRGDLVCDRAAAGERFQGMRETVECRQGEIILRDDEGIIATLFQGPDHRTRLKKGTKDVVFFVFSAPGLTVSDVQQGMEVVSGIFKAVCQVVTCKSMIPHDGSIPG